MLSLLCIIAQSLKLRLLNRLYFFCLRPPRFFFFFFLNDPAPPEIHPLPLHAPLPTPPTAPACGASGSPNDRLLFVARFDANIDVSDTYFGAQVGTISTRAPIVGPLRVAKDASGNQLLFGITSRGVVMVSLPAFTNPLPAPPRR